MIKKAISKIIDKQDLTFDEAKQVMDLIMSGKATDVQISSILTSLRMKGETIEEITAFAQGMRDSCQGIKREGDLLEIVGTGGDESFTFNISTASAIVAAAAGIRVAKHGNRSVSSKCGAADVLEALGVKIDIDDPKVEKVLEKTGICFMFAQKHHSSMKYVATARKEMGTRTVFNILGPLANPANANMQILGVYSESFVEPLAKVLSGLGVTRGMVVYGQDGIDEISLAAPTTICEINGSELKTYIFNPEDYGFKICKKEDLVGGDPKENAEIILSILKNEKGPKRDVVIINSAMCIYLAKKDITLEQAIDIAKATLDSGKAYDKLQQFIKATNEVE